MYLDQYQRWYSAKTHPFSFAAFALETLTLSLQSIYRISSFFGNVKCSLRRLKLAHSSKHTVRLCVWVLNFKTSLLDLGLHAKFFFPHWCCSNRSNGYFICLLLFTSFMYFASSLLYVLHKSTNIICEVPLSLSINTKFALLAFTLCCPSSSPTSSFTFRHFSASCSGISLIYSSCCFTFVAFPYCFKINLRHYLLKLTFDLFECNLTASITRTRTGARTGARTRATRKSKMLQIGSKGFFQAWMLSHKFNNCLLDIF